MFDDSLSGLIVIETDDFLGVVLVQSLILQWRRSENASTLANGYTFKIRAQSMEVEQ